MGREPFTDERVADPARRAFAAMVRYVIDPDNDDPDNYRGHLRARFRDGRIEEYSQPHFRGGVREPLSREEIVTRLGANIRFGGWSPSMGDALLELCLGIADAPAPLDPSPFRT